MNEARWDNKQSWGPLIRVVSLYKFFRNGERELRVLQGLSLDVYQGDTIAIMGESGAGKSTLLQILGTLEPPTEGQVLYRGEDLFAQNERSLADFRNRNIGFVFQFHHLLPEFNALENVMMPMLIRGHRKKNAAQAASQILNDVGLADRITHKPGELSGGEQQRVAVARALVLEPEILLADEPTGNLDQNTGEGIEGLLVRMNERRGVTIILVTHKQRLAARMKYLYNLADGQLEAV
ncbi:MAG: ABC transporter ATP-binding protein [Deltaproteobacteria bacterium]|nr:ABC transporter ATP-binding protein [Deltaproteobacteria bacterium]